MANKRALIVDDSTTAQYRLKKMLRRYPLDIDVADSGEAALRYLAHNVPDVIFMDHTMSGMDGFRALQIIKSHPETAMVPVIMYTAQSGDVYTSQARALGALDVVSKDTINATDLSKVMEAIHIYQGEQTDARTDQIESAELIAAANKVTDINTHRIERRAPNPATLEQARNLELRLSHMEHTLEDNRRFITSRVVRELQGLRKNLREELNDILHQQQAAVAPTALPAPETEQSAKKDNTGWSITTTLVSIAALLVIAYFLVQISQQLNQSTQVQEQLGKQLQDVSTRVNREPELISPAMQNAGIGTQPPLTITRSNDFITDLAWTFNQSGTLAFKQNTIDPKPVLRLHELLHRIASNGFKGTATITIFVGNFCVSIDNMGMAQLAKPEGTLGDCMLSSEIYMLERVMDEYTRETNAVLSNLTRPVNSTLRIIVNAAEGPDSYPERIPTVSARDWNTIAQNNNRIELVLTPDEE
ncbi:response regulator [Cellvibrio mixtus]|uniref:response regulator n=1 Tax=Cellvibrio mixtus TaxID=39650 RepID=UPI0005872712|nr:response regulator [Cellvibrio mixtus]